MASKFSLVHSDLKDQIYSLLKEKVLSGVYKPGTRLVIDLLAEEFEVSRTPIRDAIHGLVSQGLIISQGKGYNLINPTIDEILDISSIRLSLESLAVEQCANRCSDEDIEVLREYVTSSKELLESVSLYEDYDIDFHNKILSFSKNTKLPFYLGNVRDLWWLIRKWSYPDNKGRIRKITTKQHEDLVEKIANRDPKGAVRVMTKHHKLGEKEIIKSYKYSE